MRVARLRSFRLSEALGQLSRARAQERAPGCLLCNAAIERAPTREASRASTSRYVERITAGVVNALTHERERGAARSEAELTALGHHLSAVLLGLFVMVRAGVDAEILDDAVRLAIEQVDAFAGDGSSSGR